MLEALVIASGVVFAVVLLAYFFWPWKD